MPELHLKYGPIIRLGPNEVHIHDLSYFNQLLAFRPLNKWAMTGKQFGISEAIFGTEDYKHYTKKRAAFGDSFSRSNALKLQDLMNEHINKACEIITQRHTEGRTVDLAYIYRGAPADIFTEFIFGKQFNFIDDEVSTRGLYDRKHEVLFGMFNLGRHIYFLIPLLCDLIWQKMKQTAGGPQPQWSMLGYISWAKATIQEIQEEMKDPSKTAGSRKMKPVMTTFMEAKLADSDKTISALSQQGVAVWSGGWETVGTTITLGTYQLLRNSKMADQLKSELRTAWPDIRLPPSMDALDACPYLTAVIKESLRFTPPPGRLSRYNPRDVERYKDYEFPPGTIISTSLSMVSRDPSIWGSDADVFRPERWIGKENAGGELDQWAVAFSKGTHVCAGLEIAWVEMRLLFAHIFRKFDLSIDTAANITDDDILTYHDGFTGVSKNWCQRLPVWAKPVSS
ncbi:related to trichodiene oxygenase cytochrome P450 [Phialocephala subalpina]|uniref:Related to trichodiene oxygenase cytochrome P450 n=1 Tax=Phialocephala subalpina TaxID=576137 RepID=A0A1L7WE26_9HELO|nr:related to trichodiene oxygenase cytochrome P450 [Phialocephala subalpina]